MSRRLIWAIALACATLTLTAASAAAQQWRPTVRQCFSSTPAPGCTTVTGPSGAWNVGVSPDGRTAYSLSLGNNNPRPGSIHVYTRNPATGALTLKPGADGCITSAAVAGCVQARGIARPNEIMFSSDGRFVYVSSEEDVLATPSAFAGGVAVFRRNTTTGVLEQLTGMDGCINEDGSEGCATGVGIGGKGALLSPDQKNLYVLGKESLAVLNRNTTTGVLTAQACFGVASFGGACMDIVPRPGGRQLALSGDGRQLYTPAGNGQGALPAHGGLRIFGRNTTTGALSLGGCVTRGVTANCGRATPIGAAPQNVVISPDSRHVYLSHGGGIVTFVRNANGSLAFGSCINDTGTLGCANSSNTSNLVYMAASPDGQDVVAVPQGAPAGLTAFARNATSGALTRRPGADGCITPDGRGLDNGVFTAGACRADARVGQFGQVRFRGDGTLLAGFFSTDRIVDIKRDFFPVCQSRAVTVRRNTAQAIPLTCSDRNGEPVARAIVQSPNAGTLGSINQGAGTVIYDPFSNFVGNDQFTFRATAGALTGAPASIAITIPGRANRPRRIRAGLAFTFNSFSDHTVLTKLVVRGVPRGGRVRAVCTFRGRRCGGKARRPLVKRGRGSVSLASRFVGVDLRVGARITITVTKRGSIGAAKLMTIRSRKAPKIASRCLRPGSGKLRKRC
jgi:DNA-binding beta-propeller fold protein YncE